MKRRTMIATALFVVALIAGAVFLFLRPSKTTLIENAVRAELIDPTAALFRHVVVFKDGGFCGEVNSKNRFGGYAGYGWFTGTILPDGKAQVLQIDSADDRVVAAVCAKDAL